jgi:hypothetical protein
MSKFTFVCEDDAMPFAEGIATKKTFEFESHRLDVVLSEFQDFLKGCGFSINGHLQIIKPEKQFFEELNTMFTGIHANETVTVGGGGVDVISLSEKTFSFHQDDKI